MMLRSILNKLGYYKLEQLKFGGVCGCCGNKISNWAWVDTGDNWDDIGLCDNCRSDDLGADTIKLVDAIEKRRHSYDRKYTK